MLTPQQFFIIEQSLDSCDPRRENVTHIRPPPRPLSGTVFVKFGFETSGVATEPNSYQRIFWREEISSADTVRQDCKPILFICGIRSQGEPLHIVNLMDFMEGGQTQGRRLPPTDFTCAFLSGGSATLAKVTYSVAKNGDTIVTVARVPPSNAECPVIC
jgi:hypothetical protein